MNERIKELIEYCGLPTSQDLTLAHEVEKLVELIVRECAKVSFKSDMECSIGQWGSTAAILKHFDQLDEMDSIVSEWQKSRVKQS